MRIELLPSSIPSSDAQFLVSFIINDSVAIDAGSIGLLADLERQRAIRHVFITHEHLDHIASLAILLENVYEPGPDCIELLAAPEVLEFLHSDVFNGRVWPDFFELSSPENAFLRTTVLEPMVPVVRGATLPITASGETSLPDWKPIACSLPPRRTRQSRRLESAFTTDTPTPCRPPEKP